MCAFGFDTWTTSVVVEETQVTDVGLKDLASLKSLQVLDLWETQVTDAGLKELAVLKSLQVVQLARTKVQMRALRNSRRRCRRLRLSGNRCGTANVLR